MNEICPKCDRKSLYFRSAFNTWRCSKCKSFFDKDKVYLGIDDMYAENTILDEFGNKFSLVVNKTEKEIVVIKTYKLEQGKTTLKTEYPKIFTDERCSHQDRLSCGSGYGFKRCKNLKNEYGNWVCKKEDS